MKRYLTAVSLIAVAFAAVSLLPPKASAQEKTPPAAPAHRIAPADEYFGRLKMSILGIANTLKDQSMKYDRQPEQLSSAVNAVNFAEDAIRDWEHKYPNDPWVAKSLFALERFYQRIDSDSARAHAKTIMVWLVHDFPSTSYARIGKQELSEGRVGAPVTTSNAAPAPIDITKPVLGDNPGSSR